MVLDNATMRWKCMKRHLKTTMQLLTNLWKRTKRDPMWNSWKTDQQPITILRTTTKVLKIWTLRFLRTQMTLKCYTHLVWLTTLIKSTRNALRSWKKLLKTDLYRRLKPIFTIILAWRIAACRSLRSQFGPTVAASNVTPTTSDTCTKGQKPTRWLTIMRRQLKTSIPWSTETPKTHMHISDAHSVRKLSKNMLRRLMILRKRKTLHLWIQRW